MMIEVEFGVCDFGAPGFADPLDPVKKLLFQGYSVKVKELRNGIDVEKNSQRKRTLQRGRDRWCRRLEPGIEEIGRVGIRT